MKVVIAIDSFKGSLTSVEAGEAVALALKRVDKSATATVLELADGGEGTVSAIATATGATLVSTTVTGPLGAPLLATYCILKDGTAVIEMAAAAGLTLIQPPQRDVLHATTYGVGELVLDAIARGCRRFIIGLGGSATNDGGAGMLQALGFSLLRADGTPIGRGAAGLAALAEIRTETAHPTLAECQFLVASDVKNPLCGKNGCSAVFGPQKGATPETVREMDAWLMHYAAQTERATGKNMANAAGAGAAGGMGFCLLSYLNARIRSGIELILETVHFEDRIKDADLIITGEGRLDSQSLMGKAPLGVAAAAAKYGKPLVALCGAAVGDAAACNAHGITAFFPILKTPTTLEAAMQRNIALQNLTDTAEQVFRLFLAAKNA